MQTRKTNERMALINSLIADGLSLMQAIRHLTKPVNDPVSVPACLQVVNTASLAIRESLTTASKPPGVIHIAPGWYSSEAGNLCYRGHTLPSLESTDPASVPAPPAVASVPASKQAPTSKQASEPERVCMPMFTRPVETTSKQAPPAVPAPPADQTQSYRPAFTYPFYRPGVS